MFSKYLMGLLTTLIALVGVSAEAGPLLITPTTIEFDAARKSAAIEIVNQSDEPVDLQFRAYEWTQQDAADQLTPTDALAISPPIVTLPPHGKQVFRVLDTGTLGAVFERTYRLRLNELPKDTANGIAINLEFSLPVFRTPRGGKPELKASLIKDSRISLVNVGNRRIRILQLTLQDDRGRAITVPSAGSTYILSGNTRDYTLPAGIIVASGAHLRGLADTGPIDVPVDTLTAR